MTKLLEPNTVPRRTRVVYQNSNEEVDHYFMVYCEFKTNHVK